MRLIARLSMAALFLLSAGNLRAQADLELFAQGQAALQHNDCYAARTAFESESQDARKSVAWLDNAAQAAECSRDPVAALKYYEMKVPFGADPELIAKIGDLRYRLSVNVPQATGAILDWIGKLPPAVARSNDLEWTFSTTLTFNASAYDGTHPNQCTLKDVTVMLTTLLKGSSPDGRPIVDAQQRVTYTSSVSLYALDADQIKLSNMYGTDHVSVDQRKVYVNGERLVGNALWFAPEGTHLQDQAVMQIVVPNGQGSQGVALLKEAVRRCKVYYGR